MTERIIAVGVTKNRDSTLHGDTALTAVLSDDSVVVLDNWYSAERSKPHVLDHECIGKSVDEVQTLVNERDVQMIKGWVDNK